MDEGRLVLHWTTLIRRLQKSVNKLMTPGGEACPCVFDNTMDPHGVLCMTDAQMSKTPLKVGKLCQVSTVKKHEGLC
ncbi:hypothetical protein FK949_gp248 [Paramecium bursaria Chlorella virus NYs1]|uniref:Uncharacterized protein n=1 Tax=Paramecium bursaria Chlorella virus NYs1 TaxID=83442 RepID=M1I3N1_9PHYC|nr:hypothetical protein FK949_gp248 [Paramecium bursaria Chlorella virus NYs1]AGE54378.1 hypothetical protein PBCVIL52s1_785R [Paramecium bursaria Chlorella virus IL-5-2s1]AGE55061.1 hypothetical protein PBCVMA1D_766R [Paramecium bursaria Chlorella virus MA1D]AGE58877.1 hypothetical protein PBCVNYs1_773R [Paramecium bursaria Chlorella virus NYs1]